MDEPKSFGVVVDLGELPLMISRIQERSDNLLKEVENLRISEHSTITQIDSLNTDLSHIRSEICIVRDSCHEIDMRFANVHTKDLSDLADKSTEMQDSMHDMVARIDRMALDLRASEKDIIDLRQNLRSSDEKVSSAMNFAHASAGDWKVAKESVDLFTVSAETLCGKFRVLQHQVEAECRDLKAQVLAVNGDVLATLTRMNTDHEIAVFGLKSDMETRISASKISSDLVMTHLVRICQRMLMEANTSRRETLWKRNLVHAWHIESMRMIRRKMAVHQLLRLLKSNFRKGLHSWQTSVKLVALESRLRAAIPDVVAAIESSTLAARVKELELAAVPPVSSRKHDKLVQQHNTQIAELVKQLDALTDSVDTMKTSNKQLNDMHSDNLLLWNNMKQIDKNKVDQIQVEHIVHEQMRNNMSDADRFEKLADMITGLQKCLSQRAVHAKPVEEEIRQIQTPSNAHHPIHVLMRPGSAQTSSRKSLAKASPEVDLAKQHTDMQKNLELRGIRPGSAISGMIPPTTAGFLLQRVNQHVKK